jgi:hypothetical protein
MYRNKSRKGMIGEQAAEGNANEKQHLLHRKVVEGDPAQIHGIEAPHAEMGEIHVPDPERNRHRKYSLEGGTEMDGKPKFRMK